MAIDRCAKLHTPGLNRNRPACPQERRPDSLTDEPVTSARVVEELFA
jgi:hypothetical protein